MRAIAVLGMLLAGCADDVVDSGAACDLGWVDADGELVACGPDLLYTDPAGVIWQVNEETGELGAMPWDEGGVFIPVFEDEGCQGEAFSIYVPDPFVAFEIVDPTDDVPAGPHAVLSEDYAERGFGSIWFTGEDSCTTNAVAPQLSAPHDALQAVELPDGAWVGPLSYGAL